MYMYMYVYVQTYYNTYEAINRHTLIISNS